MGAGIEGTCAEEKRCDTGNLWMQGEVPEQAQVVLGELETFLTQVVGTEGNNKNLDDTEEAYLLNYTDSITLSDMPVIKMLWFWWLFSAFGYCPEVTHCHCTG